MQRTNRQKRCGHTGAVKDLEACRENGIVFASNGLWGHNPARQGFDPPDTPPERRDEHEEKNP